MPHDRCGEHCGEDCKHIAPVPMQQSLEEVQFEKGLWGYILRSPSAAQVELFIAKSDVHRQQVDAPDASGYTPILYAAREGRADICAVLLRNGASPNAVTPRLRQSALMRAATQGHAETVRLLLAHGADPTLVDHFDKTALDYADQCGHGAAKELVAAALGARHSRSS